MPDIVLATINARYMHASLGLRCLRANLRELRERSALVEFTIGQKPLEIADALLAFEPRVLGLGVYVWNVTPVTELVMLLRRLRPSLVIVLGGPEVSYEFDRQEVVRLADHVVTGEGDYAFQELCQKLLSGGDAPPKIIPGGVPRLDDMVLPYGEYTDEDIVHRLVYVEASRGCPFECEFCLSSLDVPVRDFPLDRFLGAMDGLWRRGLRHFKFVDRTFNLRIETGRRILGFFLERLDPALFLHFEMIPDRLPREFRELIVKFPPGSLQFEIGVQTFNPEAAAAIRRRQDIMSLEDNFRFLHEETSVHVHADLIAGLPGEDIDSFGRGFDRLIELRPQEIQVGILKRLRGTSIGRHDSIWDMTYSPLPPYEMLQNRLIDFAMMQRLRHFARYWDLIGNSGRFIETVSLLWSNDVGPFRGFLRFSDWLYRRVGKHHDLALPKLMGEIFAYLVEVRGLRGEAVAETLWRDALRAGQAEMPPAVKSFIPPSAVRASPSVSSKGTMHTQRQARHRGGPDLFTPK